MYDQVMKDMHLEAKDLRDMIVNGGKDQNHAHLHLKIRVNSRYGIKPRKLLISPSMYIPLSKLDALPLILPSMDIYRAFERARRKWSSRRNRLIERLREFADAQDR